jgi:hypothetical protein
MQHRRTRRHHTGLDRITALLAGGALACLGVLGGCGPQNAVPLDGSARTGASSGPVPAAHPRGTPVPAAHKAAAPGVNDERAAPKS